ncbi:MAG: N-acetylglucosamine-6-phosphate deacetylase [Limisphaerales bacterium]
MPGLPRVGFHNGTLILPDQLVPGGAVVCQGGKITRVGRRVGRSQADEWVDARGGYISPGFVDIHVHGGDGADFMDADVDAIRVANRCHARHGTTTLFPTTTTGSPAQLSAMLRACKTLKRRAATADGARIAGVHFYGPYFAPDKVGCHSLDGCRDPVRREYLRHFETGIIRIATCAAELPGAQEFYREARRRRCLVTCGHSNATWTEMAAAYKAGMRHVDHFWCAMSSVASLRERVGTPMQASMEQFVLANPGMSTEVIADGCHLAPELLEFAYRMIGSNRLCLVTDANRAVDQPPGRYRFGPAKDGSWFVSDGKVGRMPDGRSLASSIMCLDTMVRNMKRMTGATLPEVIRMATLTPAERAGVSRDLGSLEKGKRADVVLLSSQLKVREVYLGGERFES